LSRYACLLGRDSPSRGRRCFFFQAEDGIRAFHVTGVQTCALPILAERYFGPIEKREIPSAKRPLELDEPGERRLTLHLNTQVPSLMMAFNTASLATETDNPRQIHALRLIAALLDGGYSARLPQQLERGEELVTSASAWYNAYARGDSLFVLSAAPNMQKGRTLEEVEAGLWR